MRDENFIKDKFDALIMFCWYGSGDPLNGNRLQVAKQFSRVIPVYIIYPDQEELLYFIKDTYVKNVFIIHVTKIFSTSQAKLIKCALNSINIVRPLLWIYNIHFIHSIFCYKGALKIYHASEDYFDPLIAFSRSNIRKLIFILKNVDHVISVSEGVARSIIKYTKIKTISVVENSCDFDEFGLKYSEMNFIQKQKSNKIILFHGNIRRIIDFELLSILINRLPEWQFWFCGVVLENFDEWEAIVKNKNVHYYGQLNPIEIKKLMIQADVGIIPYVQNNYIKKVSLPLKAYEYIAAGLPVVTIPIDSLSIRPDIFFEAQNAEMFVSKIQECAQTRRDCGAIMHRLSIAKSHNYKGNFRKFVAVIMENSNKESSLIGSFLNFSIYYFFVCLDKIEQ